MPQAGKAAASPPVKPKTAKTPPPAKISSKASSSPSPLPLPTPAVLSAAATYSISLPTGMYCSSEAFYANVVCSDSAAAAATKAGASWRAVVDYSQSNSVNGTNMVLFNRGTGLFCRTATVWNNATGIKCDRLKATDGTTLLLKGTILSSEGQPFVVDASTGLLRLAAVPASAAARLKFTSTS